MGALTFAGALAQDLTLPPLPTDSTTTTTTTTTPADKVTNEERCGSLPYHFTNGPQPTGKELCPSYSCYSCCDDQKVTNEFNKVKNENGQVTKYSIFDFS